MDQFHRCNKCNLMKPYPSDFIHNYKTLKKGNRCIDCRKILRKEQRRKLLGKPGTKAGWKDKYNIFNTRLTAKKPITEE